MKMLQWDRKTLYRNGMLAFVLLTVALLVHEIYGTNGYLALRRQQREVEILEKQIQQLKQENEQLGQQIKALRSDPQAIERLAREQMQMARPGETIYKLPEKDSKKPPSAARETPPK